jgi:hypothetical protein
MSQALHANTPRARAQRVLPLARQNQALEGVQRHFLIVWDFPPRVKEQALPQDDRRDRLREVLGRVGGKSPVTGDLRDSALSARSTSTARCEPRCEPSRCWARRRTAWTAKWLPCVAPAAYVWVMTKRIAAPSSRTRRSTTIAADVSRAERRAIERAAAERGVTLSQCLRLALLEFVQHEETDHVI